jgi:hypothetical protein
MDDWARLARALFEEVIELTTQLVGRDILAEKGEDIVGKRTRLDLDERLKLVGEPFTCSLDVENAHGRHRRARRRQMERSPASRVVIGSH